MKQLATKQGREEQEALERMLELDVKAAQLRNRNLSRYMHQLQYAKRECERELARIVGSMCYLSR